ncbi:MAG: RnfABCDGE type electron transport complex subunit D [Desertifilum sp.]|nr:RnfABCDGE type electron transport complex subunit D [Desertifilum sp.]
MGRWDTTASFLGSYALLEAARNAWLGWTWDVYAHRLMSGSLLLFAFFMITDPRSIPNARIGRVLWAIGIAVVTFILRNSFFCRRRPILGLICPLSLQFSVGYRLESPPIYLAFSVWLRQECI